MEKFKINKTYTTKSICDSNCIWNFKVEKRTDKNIWIKVDNEIKRFKIIIFDNIECIFPLGKYSMSPILRASNLI